MWFVHHASSGEGEPTRRDGGWDPTGILEIGFLEVGKMGFVIISTMLFRQIH